MLAISTSWNAHRHTDGEHLLGELRSIGFTNVELAAGTRIWLVPGIKRLLQRGRSRVIAVQAPCPLPIDPSGLQSGRCHWSSPESARRDAALQWIRTTIDYASDLGASFVVLAPGPTAVPGFSTRLGEMVQRGRLHSRAYVNLKLQGIRLRERESPAWLARARHSLAELLPHARSRNLRLVLSPGEEHEQGPGQAELLALLGTFREEGLGYWHDFSLIQKRANLGFLDHAQWLSRFRPYLDGCHVNDSRWPDETHRAPFSGMVDFDRLVPLLPEGVPLVWNLTPKVRQADLRQSLAAWEERFPRLPPDPAEPVPFSRPT